MSNPFWRRMAAGGLLLIAPQSAGPAAAVNSPYDEVVIDFLNDETPPPQAFSIRSGRMEGGEAEFLIYQVTPQFEYHNLTPRMNIRRAGISASVRTAPGSRSVAGSLRLELRDGEYRFVYRPRHRKPFERTALLTARWQSSRGVRTGQFLLEIPANSGPTAQPKPAPSPGVS